MGFREENIAGKKNPLLGYLNATGVITIAPHDPINFVAFQRKEVDV